MATVLCVRAIFDSGRLYQKGRVYETGTIELSAEQARRLRKFFTQTDGAPLPVAAPPALTLHGLIEQEKAEKAKLPAGHPQNFLE